MSREERMTAIQKARKKTAHGAAVIETENHFFSEALKRADEAGRILQNICGGRKE